MILDMLIGEDNESSQKIAELKEIIGKNPRILWYPSSGYDYRDIYETKVRYRMFFLHIHLNHIHHRREPIDLYIHTDCDEDLAFAGEKVYGKNFFFVREIYEQKRNDFENHPDISKIEMISKYT